MSRTDFDDVASFKQSVNICSTKFRNIQKPIKAANGFHPIKGAPIFCQAIFTCPSKHLKRVLQKKTKTPRNYQVCLFDDHCNQQSYEPVYWEV